MDDTKKKIQVGVLLNIAPHYREPIFRLMDEEFDCKWVFGENESDIPSCRSSFMNDVIFLPVKKNIKGFYTLKGWKREILGIDSPVKIIALGEIKFIPTWHIMIRNLIVCKKRRKEVILWTHGWYGNEHGLQKLLTRVYFKLADKVLFYGERGRDIAVRNGLNPAKASVIHNSLDHSVFHTLREKLEKNSDNIASEVKNIFTHPGLPLLVYIGRLSNHKGLELLIEALSSLKTDGKEMNAIIIGDGPARLKIKETIDNYDLGENIHLAGAIYDITASAPLIYVADACVSPGHIGLTTIHSLELGTPVITHSDFTLQAPEIEVIKPNVNGGLFKYGDLKSLKDVIIKTTDKSRKDRSLVRTACYRSLEGWTPDYQIKVIRKALQE